MDFSKLKQQIEIIKSNDLTDKTKNDIVDSILSLVDILENYKELHDSTATAIKNINELSAKLVQTAEIHKISVKQIEDNVLNNVKLIGETNKNVQTNSEMYLTTLDKMQNLQKQINDIVELI